MGCCPVVFMFGFGVLYPTFAVRINEEGPATKIHTLLEKDYVGIMSALNAGTSANGEALRSADDLWRITKIMIEALSASGILAFGCGLIAVSAGIAYLRARELALELRRLRAEV
jgi:hypothetical protein